MEWFKASTVQRAEITNERFLKRNTTVSGKTNSSAMDSDGVLI